MIPHLRNDTWRKPQICYLFGLDDAGTAAAIAGMASTAASGISAATAGKTNARGSRLAHRQHEWAVQDAKMQREWALEDWNRNAEYNSPSAVLERYKEAGLSPMAALDNGIATEAPQTASPTGVAMPSAPHFVNPLGDMPQIMNAANDALRSVFSAKKMEHEIKNLDSDTEKKIAETDFIWSKKRTEDALRDGRVNYLGVQINLGKSQERLNDKTIEKYSSDIAKQEQEIQNLKQTCELIGADISLKNFQRYAMRQKLPYEKYLMCATALAHLEGAKSEEYLRLARKENLESSTEANKNLARNYDIDDVMKRAYYGTGKSGSWWYAHQHNINMVEKNEALQSEYGSQQARGKTKTQFLYSVDNAMESLGNVILPINKTLQGFMYYQIGQSRIMPSSSPNGSLRGYNQPHSSTDGYSQRLGRWMPDSYFDGF